MNRSRFRRSKPFRARRSTGASFTLFTAPVFLGPVAMELAAVVQNVHATVVTAFVIACALALGTGAAFRQWYVHGTRFHGFIQEAGRVLRLVLGWALIVFGLIVFVLPIPTGIFFIMFGVMLIGRRSRLIRLASVTLKRLLRRLAASPRPLIRDAGRKLLALQRQVSRQLAKVTLPAPKTPIVSRIDQRDA